MRTGTPSPTSDAYLYVGTSGGDWATASNWWDSTLGVAAAYVPGALTPVSITAAGPAFTVISGNASAASLAAIGDVGLAGIYAVGGGVSVGGVSLAGDSRPQGVFAAGVLALAAGGTLSANSVVVADGTLSATTGAVLTAASVDIGSPYDTAYAVGGGVSVGAGPSGVLDLLPGATLSDLGALALVQGTLAVAGGRADIGGALEVGAAAGAATTATAGLVLVTAGGTLSLAGALAVADGALLVAGAGSRVTAAATLEAAAGTYVDSVGALAVLVASGGGSARFGGLLLDAPAEGTAARGFAVYVDASSTVEIGSAGTASAGALTVDAGRTLRAGASTVVVGTVVDDGSIAADAGTLSIVGGIGGEGTVGVAAGATLALQGSVAAGLTIALADAGATLAIASASSMGATITGLRAGDSIVLPGQSVSRAAYVPGAAGAPGTLALWNGAVRVATLVVAGDFTGQTFLVAPTLGNGAAIAPIAEVVAGTGTPSPTSDAYSYVGTSGGDWATASNWWDSTLGVAAAYVPGALTPVSITAAGPAFTVISGNASAASLAAIGDVGLAGIYAVGGGVSVGGVSLAGDSRPQGVFAAGVLALAAGGTLSANSVVVADGTLSATTGAVLTAASVDIGSPYDTAYAVGGGVSVGAGPSGVLDLLPGATLSDLGALALVQGTLAVAGGRADIGGALEVGAAAGAATTATAGLVLVTAGGTLSLAGALAVADGALLVAGAGSRVTAAATLEAAAGTYVDSVGALAVLVASGGGSARFGGLLLDAPAEGTAARGFAVYVDASSTVEIGSAGTALAGALTVDAGRTLRAGASTVVVGTVVDDGSIAADAGTLSIVGGIGGEGTVGVAAGATLALQGSVAAGLTIALADAGATLAIASASSMGATITGLRAGDSIVLPGQSVSRAAYVPGAAGAPGTLALWNGAVRVATLVVAGDFTGQTFLVAPTLGNGAAIAPIAEVVAGTGTPSPTSDAYSYVGTSGGDWATASNWWDSTLGVAAAYVPGALTPVSITAAGPAFTVISGNASAASLAAIGDVGLAGIYAVGGGVSVGGVSLAGDSRPQGVFAAGVLALAAGGTLSANSVVVADGTLSATTGAVLTAASVDIGSPYDTAYAVGGGVSVGGGPSGVLDLLPGATLSDLGALALVQGTLAVAGGRADIGGALEVGAAAGAATTATAGLVLVTAGGTLSLAGALAVADGALLVAGAGSRVTAAATLEAAAGTYVDSVGALAVLVASGGGSARFGGLLLDAPAEGTAARGFAVYVDASSTVEIGSAGTASAGALTVDAGRTLRAGASTVVVGTVVDDGSIAADAGTLSIAGGIGGDGTVGVAAGATLALQGSVAAGLTIALADAGATLAIASASSMGATITGLRAGDSIVLPGQSVSRAAYVPGAAGAPGTLALWNGAVRVAALAVAGDFTGQTFLVAPTLGNGAAIAPFADLQALPPTTLAGIGAADAAALAAAVAITAVSVADTAAAVQTNLDSLEGVAASGKLAGITLTDPASPTLTVTSIQLAADAGALAAIGTAHALVVSGVSAAAAPVAAASPAVVAVSVNDTAQQVQRSLDGLETLARAGTLAAVRLTDAGMPVLTLTAAQFAVDADALARIDGTYALAVTYASAGVTAGIAGAPHVASIAVSDTAASVSANLDSVEFAAARGKLAGIVVTDAGTPTLALSDAQLAADAAAVALIVGGVELSVTGVSVADLAAVSATPGVVAIGVRDAARGVQASLDALQVAVASGQLASVTLVDAATPTLSVTASQLARDAGALARIGGAFAIAVTDAPAVAAASAAATVRVASVTVRDTAASVQANLDALRAVAATGRLAGIEFTDAGTPTLTLPASQRAADAVVLALVATPYALAVNGVVASGAASLATGSAVVSIAVVDSAAGVQASLDALEGVARAGKLGAVSLTDVGVPRFVLAASQYLADADALGHVAGRLDIWIGSIVAAAAAAAASAPHVAALDVVDSAAGVRANLDALEGVAAQGKLDAITLTDAGPVTLALDAGQLTRDAGALARIRTPFAASVTITPDENGASITLGAGVSTVVTGGASASIATGADGGLLFLGTGAVSVASNGADTVVGGGGSATVSAASSSPLVFALGGPLAFFAGSGASTVISGTSATALAGGSGPTLLFSDGPTSYLGRGGADTVVGLNGSLSVQAGAGGGVFFGGTAGGNRITAGSGDVTVFGAGSGDVMNAAGVGRALVAGGLGAETISGVGSSGANTFFAGYDDELLAGGAGDTALVAGPGSDTLAAGSGLTLIMFVNGRTGGTDVVTGWDPSHDFVKLAGYTTATADVLRHASVAQGATTLTLSDGTHVTFAGVTQLAPTSFT